MESSVLLVVVVPVKGKGEILAKSLSSIVEAVRQCPRASLILVDNNEPQTTEPGLYIFSNDALIVRSTAHVVGGVRNDGVRASSEAATHFVFVDCDCVVRPTFCLDVVNAFEKTKAAIVGCKVVSPKDGHWTELAGDALHRQEGDGPRKFLNSGCLAVRAENFHRIGGFSETLPANEDYEFCARVRASGGVIWQLESLRVVHLGNPKSVSGFIRRLAWHGSGVIRSDWKIEWSLMLFATLLHSTLSVTGLMLAAFVAFSHRWLMAMSLALVSCTLVPFGFWLLRVLQMKRFINPISAVALMQLTFLARQVGLVRRIAQLRRGSAEV